MNGNCNTPLWTVENFENVEQQFRLIAEPGSERYLAKIAQAMKARHEESDRASNG